MHGVDAERVRDIAETTAFEQGAGVYEEPISGQDV